MLIDPAAALLSVLGGVSGGMREELSSMLTHRNAEQVVSMRQAKRSKPIECLPEECDDVIREQREHGWRKVSSEARVSKAGQRYVSLVFEGIELLIEYRSPHHS